MRRRIHLLLFAVVASLGYGSELDTIGIAALRQFDASLNGAGLHVAHPEAGAPYWQVNPLMVGQNATQFTWTAQSGTSTNFPNNLGFESGHANQVGNLFYGAASGVAPGLIHIDTYEGQFFYTNNIQKEISIPARVVNQSFILVGETATVNLAYDTYVDRFGTVFVSGVGNGGQVNAPATCYNGIGVAAYGGASSTGPNVDGRSKPDITAPAEATSYSTPLVAGAAAILIQAALRNDGGAGTGSAASDARTVKALLLNGAKKAFGWTNSPTGPLDPNFGAGILNIYNSYGQLRAGKRSPDSSENVLIGSPHLPPGGATYTPVRRGWDFDTISGSVTRDGINHYCFEVLSTAPRAFEFAGTLVWHRQSGQATINDLNLFLYNADSNTLVTSSESLVDNVEHIRATNLPPGRYNLQVLKRGGPPLTTVSSSETYGLAFEFGPPESAQFSNAQRTDGQFAARLIAEPLHQYIVQRSQDLATWTPALTNATATAGYFDFSLPESGPRNFYRAMRAP
jgi:hypothetical protein